MQLRKVFVKISICMFLFSCSSAIKTSKSSTINNDITKQTSDSSKKVKPLPYKDVITPKAITDSGLFIVHKVDGRYLFEIPNLLFQREILVVSRIAKAAAGVRPFQVLSYAGDEIGEKVMVFTKGPNNKLFIKLVSFRERSTDSSENGMYRTVSNSNLWPIIGSFDIKAYSFDSSAAIIDVTDFLHSENELLDFDPGWKGKYQLGSIQKDKSYIAEIKSFPLNVELRTVNSYLRTAFTATYELNNSFVLLPEEPMKPRSYDKRVGYFFRSYINYDIPQRVDYSKMITRWRLEPKEEDKERYIRGELVEPKKPIVYYIDPATPKKWIPYLIQGVNDWQKSFEKAGFKNAIYALEAPVDSPDFSLYDARHNAIIYKASNVANASGPNIHDPRSGEIIESHINWYHNVMELLHDWYFVQAGPNDLNARNMVFEDSLMGKLIRYVACHEVGHTLGLMHNFGASCTVPVDSLRSKKYVDKNGYCPSIMDYARFNYVAQPEDSLTQEELFPRIGIYDHWAIEWGYRWLPQLKTNEDEKKYMNKWIINSLKNDNRLWYGPQDMFGEVLDPRAQSGDLGDDAVKAGNYGIQNLKRVYENLLNWTKESNSRYESLERLQENVFFWYRFYLSHVCNNIGLYMTTEKTVEQEGHVISFISKEKQKEAIAFLNKQLFETPNWLLNKNIYYQIQDNPLTLIPSIQLSVINYLFNYTRYYHMEYAHVLQPEKAYSFDELLQDMEKSIFKELANKSTIDFYRRNLQICYIEKLIKELNASSLTNTGDENEKIWRSVTGYTSVVRAHANKTIETINKAIHNYKDEESKRHLILLCQRLKQGITANPSSTTQTNNNNSFNYPTTDTSITAPYLNCWQNQTPLF